MGKARGHTVKSAALEEILRGAEKHLLFAVLEAILVILVTAASGPSWWIVVRKEGRWSWFAVSVRRARRNKVNG